MPKLLIAPLANNRAAVSLDGDPLRTHAARFIEAKHFDAAAAALRVPKAFVADCLAAWRADATKTAFDLPQAETGTLEITVRGLNSRDGITITDTPEAAFAAALAAKCDAPEPVITWRDTDHVAALDVDFPGEGVANYLVLLDKLDPTPAYSWSSHGGGLRGIYFAKDGATAAEFAAVAALNLTRYACGDARFEILNTTRHPAYPRGEERCGEVRTCVQSGGVEAVKSYFGEMLADEGAAAAWLEDNGYAVGQRYGHDRCPVNPSSHGKRDPVIVGERSIYCHVCHASGITYGSRNPGTFPYAALTGAARSRGRLSLCVANFVHWDHARHLWADAIPDKPESVLRAMYSAALRIQHGDDPRREAVFLAGRNTLRFDGYWGNHVGQTFRNRVGPILAALPACKGPDGKPVAELVARFEQSADISDYGYAPLQPIWGVKVSSKIEASYRTAVPMLLPTKALAAPEWETRRPKYLPAGRRLREAEAWARVERLCPGIDRNYVKLLIAAKGCVELGASMPPIIFAHGTSGGAKTATARVAAGLCGDTARSISLCRDEDRFRMGIMEAKEHGTFVTVDEALKDARKDKIDPVQALNPILKLTSLSTSHKLYQGPVPMGVVPVVVITDVELPDAVRNDQQIGRRVVEVQVAGERDWASLWNAANCDGVNLRIVDEECCAAGDAIVSAVADDFFHGEPMSFFAIAESLGFRLIRASAAELDAVLRDFFAEVCRAPDAPKAVQTRCSGRGWKVIQQGQETALADLWEALRDADGFAASRRCSAADWRRVTGAAATFEARPVQGGVAVRFISRETHKTYAVNDELVAGSRRADGFGDAERGEPAERRGDGIPARFFDAAAFRGVSVPWSTTLEPDLD